MHEVIEKGLCSKTGAQPFFHLPFPIFLFKAFLLFKLEVADIFSDFDPCFIKRQLVAALRLV